MERTYTCTGLGKKYIVSANSPTAAKVRAGTLYKGDTNAPYNATFYAQYFEPRVKDPKKPGRPPVLPILAVEGTV